MHTLWSNPPLTLWICKICSMIPLSPIFPLFIGAVGRPIFPVLSGRGQYWYGGLRYHKIYPGKWHFLGLDQHYLWYCSYMPQFPLYIYQTIFHIGTFPIKSDFCSSYTVYFHLSRQIPMIVYFLTYLVFHRNYIPFF